MRVILLGKIRGLGEKNDVKTVADGYARNFLLPKNLAVAATSQALRALESEKKILVERREKKILELKKKAELIKNLTLEFKLKTGEKNEVFGSITKKDIESKLKEKGFIAEKIYLEKVIKNPGESRIEIDLGEGVKAEVKVIA